MLYPKMLSKAFQRKTFHMIHSRVILIYSVFHIPSSVFFCYYITCSSNRGNEKEKKKLLLNNLWSEIEKSQTFFLPIHIMYK